MKKNFLYEHIRKEVSAAINEEMNRQMIRRMVAEELRRYMTEADEPSDSKKLKDITSVLDKPKSPIKASVLAYAMHPDLDPDTARSKAYKELHGQRPLDSGELNKAWQVVRHLKG